MLEKVLKSLMAITAFNGILWAMALDSPGKAGDMAGWISLVSILLCCLVGLIWRKLYE